MAAAIAFSLALFSHVLNHTIMRLHSALYDLEHPRPQLPTLPSSGTGPRLLFHVVHTDYDNVVKLLLISRAPEAGKLFTRSLL